MHVGGFIGVVAAAVVLLFLAPTAVLSWVLYRVLLVRTGPEKWGRECSIPDDEEYVRMYDIGIAWGEEYGACKEDVAIESEGFRLVGEYFDFGADRAVIIIPGRMESCKYSYFFSEPFRAAGCNVLAIDNRSHGLSEGKRCHLGFQEYRDLINWSRFLHEEKGIRSVILHGICIGASAALSACTSPDCPDYIDGMIADGMYATFAESFRNHMLEDHRPLFPIFYATMMQIRLLSGADVVHNGPIRMIDRLKKPILFLHSREDIYSVPDKAQLLYDKCAAPKELVWYGKGAHSRIRINDPEGYDQAVTRFLHRVGAAVP